jgi:Tfp pilus assembly protein PilF
MRLQLSDDGDLSEIENCLKKALSLDPTSIEALEEAAHFYDAVVPNAQKARKFAARCRDKAVKVAAEMDNIIKELS